MVAVLTRRILLVSLVAGVICVIAFTWRWQLMVDSPIMHYVDFLMSRGLAPYRQIQDNNLPGAYLAEWVGMHVFGPDDLAWRLFEFAELAVGTAAMVFIARPTTGLPACSRVPSSPSCMVQKAPTSAVNARSP